MSLRVGHARTLANELPYEWNLHLAITWIALSYPGRKLHKLKNQYDRYKRLSALPNLSLPTSLSTVWGGKFLKLHEIYGILFDGLFQGEFGTVPLKLAVP
jgi:hypothetical protein